MPVHPLLAPSPEQLALIDAVWRGCDPARGTWPLFNFVARTLEKAGIEPIDVCATLPSVGGHAAYTFIWSRSPGTVPQTADHVQLTLVGLAHVPEAEQYVRDFLQVVSNLAARAAATPVSPSEIDEVWIRSGDLISMIGDGSPLPLHRLLMVQSLIPHERATWGGHAEGSGTDWRYRLPADMARFQGTTDLESLLDRSFGPPQHPAPQIAATLAEPAAVRGSDGGWSTWCDPGLWSEVASLVEIEHWDAVAQRATVYLETELRRLGGLGRDHIGQALVTAVLHPRTGSHPLSNDEAEAGGWHQVALGYFTTVRNNTNHGHVTDLDMRYAMGIVGATSLLLTQVAIAHPGSGARPPRDRRNEADPRGGSPP